MSVKKLCIAGSLIAIGVVCSAFYIPVGASKVFPIQHFINVLSSVVLGPLYAVCMAFVTSLIRVILGTGSLLAFPGSMFGALFSGIAYKYSKKVALAFLGETTGTGIIGAIIAYPVAALFLGKGTAFAFVLPFSMSSIAGAAISVIFLSALQKTGILKMIMKEESLEL